MDANPSVTGFRRELATIHNSIGNLLRDTGEPQAALASHGGAGDSAEASGRQP